MALKTFAFLALTVLVLRPEFSKAELRTIEQKNDKGIVTQRRSYEDSYLVEEFYYNQEGILGTWLRYSYPAPNRVVKINFAVKPEEKGRIISQEEWSNLDIKNDKTPSSKLIRKWIYDDKAPYFLEYMETYDFYKENRVTSKSYFDEANKLKSVINFFYKEGREKPAGFAETDSTGQTLTKYSLFEKYDVPARLKEIGKTAEEITALQKNRESQENKILVAIIDTGFDYNHADLVTKWWNNPDDPIDGIDNDGNGWIDDNFGWEQGSNQYLPSEAIISFAKDIRPLSHGTHVAAIASHGLNNIGLIGFAGEYTDVPYIEKVSAFIKKHKVKVVNMSLGIPMTFKDDLGLRATVKAYQKMIDANPETLFVVAAGNEIKNLDLAANKQYPASFTQANVLKVGALDVGSLEKINPATTKMAYFSNWGKNSVDILAPGWEVMAARLGGGLIAHSGTSMSSPYMVNQVVQLWSELPHLSAKEVRELFIATAHKMNPAPEIRSAGYVDLQAALLQGKVQALQGKKNQAKGPNCWNASTYLAGISEDLHYTTEEEFRFILESPLCKEITGQETQKGDLLALRRFDSRGKILPFAFMSEVHGFTDLGDGTALTKNGPDVAAGYEIQSKQDIFSFFKSSEFKNCKMIGLDRKDCVMKQVAYRCQALREHFNGKLSVLENDTLLQIEILEKEIGQSFRNGVTVNNSDAKIEDIQKRVDDLDKNGSAKVLTTLLSLRLKSLAARMN